MRTDGLEGLMYERRRRLLRLIEKVMGKRIAADDAV